MATKKTNSRATNGGKSSLGIQLRKLFLCSLDVRQDEIESLNFNELRTLVRINAYAGAIYLVAFEINCAALRHLAPEQRQRKTDGILRRLQSVSFDLHYDPIYLRLNQVPLSKFERDGRIRLIRRKLRELSRLFDEFVIAAHHHAVRDVLAAK